MGLAELSARRFRVILDAMARPGKIMPLSVEAPEGLSPAQAAVALTLLDATQLTWLSQSSAALEDWFGFHAGARPQPDLALADFAFCSLVDFDRLEVARVGEDAYPDRSATIVMELPSLEPLGATLKGPGIETQAQLNLPNHTLIRRNAELYPLGLDFIFTAGEQLACLPRSTRVTF